MDRTDSAAAVPWLVRQRVMLPDPVEGFVDRERLAALCDPVQRRVTAVSAPGGFGKTTLLADVCRRARKRGETVAWLTVDQHDDPSALVAYLMAAFLDAGLQVPAGHASGNVGEDEYRLDLLLRGIAQHGARCVLALDEVDRLGNEGALGLLNRIIRFAPPNLHLALAYREHPHQLEIATSVLEGRGLVVTTEELRFKKQDIARFFNVDLARGQLADLWNHSRGWPIAVRVQRNLAATDGLPTALDEVVLNWMETRLFRGLDPPDRDFICAVGLFDWVDAELLDSVLAPGSMRRVMAMPALAGLLQPVGDSKAVRLHALVRSYCAARLAKEAPQRFRDIHSRIAEVLAGRGHVLDAMRHADEADDSDLVARILESAGGLRLWLRYGVRELNAVNNLLTPDILTRYPRLALARCALLMLWGKVEQALREYAGAYAGTRGMTRDREGGNDQDLQLDNMLLRGLYAMYGCHSVAEPQVRELMATYRNFAHDPGMDRVTRGVIRYGLGIYEHQRARFDASGDWIQKAQQDLAGTSEYMSMYAAFHEGIIAFARGRSDAAEAAYKRAYDTSLQRFVRDSGPAVAFEVYVGELNLEMNQMAALAGWSVGLEHLAERGAWLDTFMAATYIGAELALERGDADGALAGLDKGLEFALRTSRPTFRRTVAAQYACTLAQAGRLTEAERVWRNEAFPQAVAECVDLESQTWREMESICCARARWLLTAGELGAARELAVAFADAARRVDLHRSLVWALALAMAVEQQAGNLAQAVGHLNDYLRLYAQSRYVRALVSLRHYVVPVLREVDDSDIEPDSRACLVELTDAVEAAHAAHAAARGDSTPELTAREIAVLARLGHARDKEIAAALEIGENGVRYHVKNIFRKLGVTDRRTAALRAAELGIADAPLSTPPPRAR